MSRKEGFDDIRPAQPITEEQDYHNYDLISTEIQDEPRVQGYLSYFSTFAGEKITDRYAGERSRVVKTSWTPKEDMQLGTIVKVKKSGKEVHVQWDKLEEKVNLLDLRLLDNAPTEKKEKSSRVVLISRTTINNSTVSGIQAERKVNLRLLDNAPIDKIEHGSPIILQKKIEKGSRVVKRSQTTREDIPFGTIVNINQFKNEVQVKWDKPEEKVDPLDLRLYDNAPSGVKHSNVTCDECYTYPLRGIRWKCLHCDSYDLCTVCYMVDEHNVNHIFSRIQSEDSKGKELPTRFDVKLTGYAFACGILENAEVSLRKDNRKRGVVLAIRDDVVDVQWLPNHKGSRHNILELQCEVAEARQFYPDHLPILGKDTLGHVDVDFNHNNITEKIQVNIRHRSQKDKCLLMDEVFEYSKKTKLPCHIIGKKVLFLHGSSRVVCIHHTTSNHTIKRDTNTRKPKSNTSLEWQNMC
ncbi:MIB [Mytilus edulis]|uniref:MIB n=1 Tax=Mytilus edulis TaxID=6550 RepID=A0A8S3R7E9_MYTED|nr:MIB [Mytilus edulis]